MFRLNPARLLSSALLTAALVAGGSASAQACNPPRCYWKTIVTYETVEQAVVNWITKYDHCGQAYRVKVVSYETIRVPVEKQVKVCY